MRARDTLGSAASPGVQRRILPGIEPSPIAASTATRERHAGPCFENRPRLTDRGYRTDTGEPSLGDLASHRESHAVVAAEVVADADNQDVGAHLRSMVIVRKCAGVDRGLPKRFRSNSGGRFG